MQRSGEGVGGGSASQALWTGHMSTQVCSQLVTSATAQLSPKSLLVTIRIWVLGSLEIYSAFFTSFNCLEAVVTERHCQF